MARTVTVPDGLEPLADAFETILGTVEQTRGRAAGGATFDYASYEEKVAKQMGTVERQVHQSTLMGLDIDEPVVRIWGELYRRVGRHEGEYRCLSGAIRVERTLYRKQGEREGKTVDAVSLRAGATEDGWLPRTARAMAHLIAKGPSREAAQTSQELLRLPYSRSSFERVGHEVGELYRRAQGRIEQVLIEVEPVPEPARSVSVSIDRVAVPMEEPVEVAGEPTEELKAQMEELRRCRRFAVDARTKAAQQEAIGSAPRRKIARQFRMAYVATVTLHDGQGRALHTIRYGRMPQGDVRKLCQGLARDVRTLRAKRPDLRVMELADGAPELWRLFDAHLSEHELGTEPERLVDFWHLVEYLGKAAVQMESRKEAWPGQLRRWKKLLLEEDGAAERILEQLRASKLEDAWHEDAQPVRAAIRYMESRLDRMQYAKARRDGLPVGSGNVEATCKSLVGLRMKRPGARWKEKTGEQILALRALVLSDRWSSGITRALSPLQKPVQPGRGRALAA
jgi:hypothetical protein